jgi:hypothetical protein
MGGVDLPASDLEVSQQLAVREEITVFVSVHAKKAAPLALDPSARRRRGPSFFRPEEACNSSLTALSLHLTNAIHRFRLH